MAKPWENYQNESAQSAPKPWEKYQESQPPAFAAPEPKIETPSPAAGDHGAGMAALQGFGQGPLLGYLPNIQAGAGVAAQKVGEMLGGPQAETYADLKKAFMARDAALKDQHPVATLGGNVAGMLATAPLGGMATKGAGAALRGAGVLAEAAPAAAQISGAAMEAAPIAEKASLIARLGKAAASGAGMGAAYNPEESADQNDPNGELKARLNNAILGGLTGGGTEGVISGVGSALAKGGERFAKKAVVKQIGANAGQIKNILKKDEVPKLEGFLTSEGLMGVGTNLEDVAEHSGKILEQDGPKIGQLYEDAQHASQVLGALGEGKPVAISGPDLADQIVNDVKKSVKSHPDRDLVVSQMKSAVEPLRDMGENANIKDVHEFRKGLDENINWTQASRERDAVQRAYVQARNIVADKTKDTIDQLDNALSKDQPSGLLDKLKALNERYSAASTVNNISTQGLAREQAKAFMGHGVIGAGAGGGAGMLEYQRSHDPIKSVAAGLGTALAVTAARKFGTPVGYYGGKAARAAGQSMVDAAQNPVATGVVGASPWLSINRREDYGR